MRRIQLPELEDSSIIPDWYRDLMTDCLEKLSYVTKAYQRTCPLLEKLLFRSTSKRIIDFGSGGGGPWLHSLFPLLREKFPSLQLVLTDLFPNKDTEQAIAEANLSGPVTYVKHSVDMTEPQSDLEGVRVMFTSFHHLNSTDAKKCLQNAIDARAPFGIFEVTRRSIGHLLMTFLIPILVLLVTPFIKGKRVQRIIFTYLIPIVPLGCFWDGLVSNFRTYSAAEISALILSLENAEEFIFEQGEFPVLGPLKGSYLIGYL